LRHLKGALRKAFDWDYIERPVKFPPPLPLEEKSRFLSPEQLRAIFGNIPDQEFYDLCLFAICTGLRSGEILSLKWDDIDSPDGFMRIDSRQKNKRESRIPINSGARTVLNRCKARGMITVFRKISVTRVSKLFKKAVRKAKLPDDIRFHDLRHTFGSMLAMAGRQGRDIRAINHRHRSAPIKSARAHNTKTVENFNDNFCFSDRPIWHQCKSTVSAFPYSPKP
jgi:integrase